MAEPANLGRLQRDVDRMRLHMYGDSEAASEGLIKTQAKILKSIENIYRALIAISIAIGLIFVIVLIYGLQQWLP